MSTELKYKGKPACAEKYVPVPEYVVCPGCGKEAELWSDEEQAACACCGGIIGR